MATKPCLVCDYPVEVKEAKIEVWKTNPAEADGKASILVVCGSRRCQRLVKKALEEDRKRVK